MAEGKSFYIIFVKDRHWRAMVGGHGPAPRGRGESEKLFKGTACMMAQVGHACLAGHPHPRARPRARVLTFRFIASRGCIVLHGLTKQASLVPSR
jgi:hypothetical protein